MIVGDNHKKRWQGIGRKLAGRDSKETLRVIKCCRCKPAQLVVDTIFHLQQEQVEFKKQTHTNRNVPPGPLMNQ